MRRLCYDVLVQVDVADPVAGHYNPRNDVILRLEYINAKHTKARSNVSCRCFQTTLCGIVCCAMMQAHHQHQYPHSGLVRP